MGLSGALLLAGCSGSGNKYHKHTHKHQYMTKDYQYRTYQYPYNRYYYRGHYYPRSSYQSQYHHSRHYRHYRYYHRMSFDSPTSVSISYAHHKPKYPNTYDGSKFGAHTRMSTADNYGQGYAAGCRTAHTGMMYKNPKLLADSQHYQMGWETGFNQCHYDRAHINGTKDKYSYIPY